MNKAIGTAFTALLDRNAWKKLADPTVGRGATALPRSSSVAQKIGLRLDYDGYVEKGEEKVKYHRYKLQVNAGNSIPLAFKKWRDSQENGTHAVMATIEIRHGADKDEIFEALKEGTKNVRGV
ncbi:hypothetical protein CVT26_004078 [Gymnopilus dilepis]|uniref:Uncharacterized protein n=1 Tax=Gymnopilus dilepis TaxID=231916 RepID=A0A409YMJ3_9AGAR|nr:hypothetical protein CVT26_004078 [Gymnopilus dilepis]